MAGVVVRVLGAGDGGEGDSEVFLATFDVLDAVIEGQQLGVTIDAVDRDTVAFHRRSIEAL